jgi:hypothetical protein
MENREKFKNYALHLIKLPHNISSVACMIISAIATVEMPQGLWNGLIPHLATEYEQNTSEEYKITILICLKYLWEEVVCV